jgi:hypothetical protein
MAERLSGVSRGHSSEDAPRKRRTAKGRRTTNNATKEALPMDRESSETDGRDNCGHDPHRQNPRRGDGVAAVTGSATASLTATATLERKQCSRT